MEDLVKYVADNYNGLMEIYTTQINRSTITFDDFCMKMYHQYLKNNR